MTRHETFDTSSMSGKDLVLATDLDGTFLGGTDQQRAHLYDWINAHRDRVGLIFVTGRDPGFVHNLTRKEGVPRPDYLIADVGTTIAAMDHNHHVSPIAELEAEIESAWGKAGSRAQFALSGIAGLSLQSTLFRYRLSYDMDPERFDSRAMDIIAELGLDTLISDNRFFDVLPKGVSKGPSLLRLLTHLDIDNRRVLVAGHTLNDLSMLKLGVPSVAVGGSDAALIKEVEALDHVFVAKAAGAGGIAEAILHHNLFPAR